MSTKKSNVMLARKARPHHSPVKRTRASEKIQLRREASESEVAA